MNDSIKSLADLRPGDIMFGPIGGIVPGFFPVGVGQFLLGEVFRAGRMSVRHVGVVVEPSRNLLPGAAQNLRTKEWHEGPLLPEAMPFGDEFQSYPTGVITAPRIVEAMPSGARYRNLDDSDWSERHAYVRLPEDYPGQAEDAAAIARLFVTEKVPYSFASYLALVAWKWGLKAERLERWIDRRRNAQVVRGLVNERTGLVGIQLPAEAICSVLADQAWSLAGKRVMQGVSRQAVTPGAMAGQLWRRPGVIWGGPGFLESR